MIPIQEEKYWEDIRMEHLVKLEEFFKQQKWI